MQRFVVTIVVRSCATAALALLGGLDRNAVPIQGAVAVTTPPDQVKFVLFETTLIKPSKENEPFDQQLLPDGFILRNGSVKGLIGLAYNPAELTDGKVSGAGPDWVRHGGIDVLAKVSQEETVDWRRETISEYDSPVFKHAIQQLLLERYKLQAHTITTQVDGFALVLEGSGRETRLIPSNRVSNKDLVQPSPSTRSPSTPDALTILPGGIVQFRGQPISKLAEFLSGLCSFKIEDRTGLAGTYTFSITDRQPVYTTIQDKEDYRLPADRWDLKPIGFKLVRSKVHKTVVIIDHIEEPSPN